MKITAQNIENFIKSPPQNLLVALFYGQDQGLINENALALAQQLVPDLNDPFSVNTLSGEQITSDPALLFDSASTLPPMGGKRLIRINNITDTATKHIETLLTNPPTDCVIVMTSQSVNTRAKLVKLLDTNPQAATIGCYADTTQQLTKLANDIFSQHHITTDPDALNWITANLGADRLISRSELEKLAIMAGTNGHIDLNKAMTALGDSTQIATTQIIIAAANGNTAEMSQQLNRAIADATPPEAILRGAINYFLKLFKLLAMMQEGANATTAINQFKPPIFFQEKPTITKHLTIWTPTQTNKALQRLSKAEAETRKGIPANTATAQAMLAICLMVKKH